MKPRPWKRWGFGPCLPGLPRTDSSARIDTFIASKKSLASGGEAYGRWKDRRPAVVGRCVNGHTWQISFFEIFCLQLVPINFRTCFASSTVPTPGGPVPARRRQNGWGSRAESTSAGLVRLCELHISPFRPDPGQGEILCLRRRDERGIHAWLLDPNLGVRQEVVRVRPGRRDQRPFTNHGVVRTNTKRVIAWL
jgi:hypothetical protein